MSEQPIVEQAAQKAPDLESVIGRVAWAINNQLSTGDVADLRRIKPAKPFTPALWKLLLAYVPDSWIRGSDQDEKEARWAVIFMGLALTPGLHNANIPLGDALATTNWTRVRFVRLLRQRKDGLTREVRLVARYLRSKNQPSNWTDIAQLVLNQEGVWAERHRRNIARKYYQTLYRQESQSNQ